MVNCLSSFMLQNEYEICLPMAKKTASLYLSHNIPVRIFEEIQVESQTNKITDILWKYQSSILHKYVHKTSEWTTSFWRLVYRGLALISSRFRLQMMTQSVTGRVCVLLESSRTARPTYGTSLDYSHFHTLIIMITSPWESSSHSDASARMLKPMFVHNNIGWSTCVYKSNPFISKWVISALCAAECCVLHNNNVFLRHKF